MKWYQIENSDGRYLVQMESVNPIIRFSDDECAHAFTTTSEAKQFIKEHAHLKNCHVQQYQ